MFDEQPFLENVELFKQFPDKFSEDSKFDSFKKRKLNNEIEHKDFY
jgi:hypothetical protein